MPIVINIQVQGLIIIYSFGDYCDQLKFMYNLHITANRDQQPGHLH